MGASSTSSSDGDDEEAERLRSVAVDSASVAGVAAALSQQKNSNKDKKKKRNLACSDEDAAPSALKFYQARARDLLHEYLDKTFDIKFVKYGECELPDAHIGEDPEDTGFYLFKRAPSGLSDKRHGQEAVAAPKRKVHDLKQESSEMFQASVSATAIDGSSVALYAEKAKAKAFALWLLQQAEEKEAKRKEEERVALLKVQRGEQWLPSVTKDMQIESLCGNNTSVKVAIDEKKDVNIYRERMPIKSLKKKI